MTASSRRSLRTTALLLAACFLATTGAASAAPPPAAAENAAKFTVNDKARENVKTAAAEAARILEAKEYKQFVTTFMPPEMLKKFEQDGRIEATVKLIEEESAEMIKVFKTCQSLEPKMDGEDKALFDFKKPLEGAAPADKPEIPQIKFQKIGNYWYIAD